MVNLLSDCILRKICTTILFPEDNRVVKNRMRTCTGIHKYRVKGARSLMALSYCRSLFTSISLVFMDKYFQESYAK